MPDVDVLESQMFELHRRQLEDELRLPAFVLKSNLLNLAQDE